MKPIDIKKGIVKEITELFKDAKSIVFVDYRGINVAQDTALRRQMRKEGITYKVYKNRLIVRALKDLGIEGYDPTLLEGLTSVAVGADEVTPAKILANTMSEHKVLNFKFGVVNGRVVNKEEVVALSKLPTKPVLVAMLLATLQAPVAGLARALDAISKK